VAIIIVSQDRSESARNELLKEMRILAEPRHPSLFFGKFSA
jgi:hypothetical protein